MISDGFSRSSPEERSETIEFRNGAAEAGERTLVELLDRLAMQNSGAGAILAPERPLLGFGRLRLHLDEVGRTLRGFGIGQNDRVALAMPNGPEMAVAFLALASFAACAPLNPDYRFDEFDFYLSDLQARALIVQSGTAAAAVAAAEKQSIPVIELAPAMDRPAGLFSLQAADGAAAAPWTFSEAEDHALVLHTSGTTSRPKMVALKHAQLTASAANIAAGLQLTAADRCLNVMPLFHIHGLVGALLSSVAAGGSVVCAPGFDAEEFFEAVQEFSPTWYTAVPTMHQAILAYAKAHPRAVENHSLRFIRSCSAPLPAGVARELEEIFRVPVVEAYGMTEAAHQIASNPLPPKERKLRSVGLPTGTAVAVMDDKGRLLPRGEVGEIVIRGANVITRYASGAAVTDENFSAGWFRTGDQGQLDKDGYLYLTGRLKEIINRGGEKISPKEIDDVLLSHPEVLQAVTFRVPHPTLGDDVAAAVVFRSESLLAESSIREYLLDQMAAFKVPSRILIVDEIPKGATGKVKRTEMTERYAGRFAQDDVAPKNGLEERITGIYREVLGVESVGRGDSFFELGGDSLRAGQVINRVRAQFEVNLSVADIFRNPTVAELAMEIDREMQAESGKQ